MTLPLIYSLNKAARQDKNRIINYIKNESQNEEKVAEVIRFVKASGGIEYAHEAMMRYRDESLAILSTFPAGQTRDALASLVHFFTDRKN